MKDWGERFQTTTTEHRAALNLPPNRKEPAGTSVGEELKGDRYDELARELEFLELSGNPDSDKLLRAAYEVRVKALAGYWRDGLSAERDAPIGAELAEAIKWSLDFLPDVQREGHERHTEEHIANHDKYTRVLSEAVTNSLPSRSSRNAASQSGPPRDSLAERDAPSAGNFEPGAITKATEILDECAKQTVKFDPAQYAWLRSAIATSIDAMVAAAYERAAQVYEYGHLPLDDIAQRFGKGDMLASLADQLDAALAGKDT